MIDFDLFKRIVDNSARSLNQREFPFSNSDYRKHLKDNVIEIIGDDDFSYEQIAYIDKKVKEYSEAGAFDSDVLSVTSTKKITWVSESDLQAKSVPPYWRAYENNLKSNPNLTNDDVRSITNEGLSIVNKLVPPKNKEQHHTKGLVYGNVQSGKTASMCAVIAQYVSMGCRFVVVLSGTTDKLREQTQDRLIRDLSIDKGVGEGYGWKLITNPSDAIRKNTLTLISDLNNIGNNVIIGVFKKNASVLKKLNDYYLLADSNSTVTARYQKISALIIDDECDQASPNVGKDDENRSSINKQIVRMIELFPKYAYVGYTATPFANVLNEGPGESSLYPESFISMLGEKNNYYGSSSVFGLGEEFEEYKNEEDINLSIIEITQDDKNKVKGKTQKILTPSEKIRRAILYFAIATAVKEWRGRELKNNLLHDQHSTMMIHTSQKTSEHSAISKEVKKIIEALRAELVSTPELLKAEVLSIWTDIYLKKRDINLSAIEQGSFTTPIDQYIIPDNNHIFDLFIDIFKRIEVCVDNSTIPLEERLVYPSDSPKYYIVVGGNTLARGFTVVGLIVTIFTRNVNTYDTLLQMGRWFGYRVGYEDLPRLFMPTSIYEKFRFLTGVEYDLRNSIERYAVEGASPMELAVPIRTTPHLQIVRKQAMKGAVRASINYTGRRPQTVYFENDKEWLDSNRNACEKLIQKNIHCLSKLDNRSRRDMFIDGYLFENISSLSVSKFIEEYQFAENSNGLDSNLLLKFKSQVESNYILRWNLVVKSLSNRKTEKAHTTIAGLDINLLERGKINDGVEDSPSLFLRALASPTDILCCVPRSYFDERHLDVSKLSYDKKFEFRSKYFNEEKNVGEPAVIIIYPIYANSKAFGEGRVDLDAKADVYGISIVFPNIKRTKDMNAYDSLSIDLSGYNVTNDDEEDEDEDD